MLYDEANLVVERVNGRIVTEAHLLQSAVQSILSTEASKEFTKRINGLSIEVRAIPDGEAEE